MKEIINNQAAEIEHLKKESMKENTFPGTLAMKRKSELNKKQKPSLLSPFISLLPKAFIRSRSQFTIPSQSSSSSSESRSVILRDLMQESDFDEEVEMENISSPGLGVDFSELIALSHSGEEEEEVMIVEE